MKVAYIVETGEGDRFPSLAMKQETESLNLEIVISWPQKEY